MSTIHPSQTLAIIRRDLREALSASRQHTDEPIDLVSKKGWAVITEREYNTPRGGPMKAWNYLYYLRTPEGKKMGGYDRADSFMSWALTKLAEMRPEVSERTKRIRAQQADTSNGEAFIVEHASPALRALDAIYAEWDLQGVSSGYKKRDAFFIEREFPG